MGSSYGIKSDGNGGFEIRIPKWLLVLGPIVFAIITTTASMSFAFAAVKSDVSTLKENQESFQQTIKLNREELVEVRTKVGNIEEDVADMRGDIKQLLREVRD